jgi:hypothetical protein
MLWDDARRDGPASYGIEAQGDVVTAVVGQDRDAAKRMCGVFALDRSLLPHLIASPGEDGAGAGGRHASVRTGPRPGDKRLDRA